MLELDLDKLFSFLLTSLPYNHAEAIQKPERSMHRRTTWPPMSHHTVLLYETYRLLSQSTEAFGLGTTRD